MEQADTFYHELKQLRIAQGIRLEDISAKTRVNIRFLEALEAGEFDVLPTTYIRLFLRSYCREIGSDEAETLQRLTEFMNESDEPYTASPLDASAKDRATAQVDGAAEVDNRGPARLRRDFITGAAIFLFLILVTFFARRVYQEAPASAAGPAFPAQGNPRPTPAEPVPPATTRPAQPGGFPPPGAVRSRSVVPEEAGVDLPASYFAQDRIVSHHMRRVPLTPPVRLTLTARDNVVIRPIIDGRQGTSINLTVAEARIWTIQNILVLQTTSIDRLRGDLNGVPIDIGEARGIGILRVTSTGEYEVFSYADTTG